MWDTTALDARMTAGISGAGRRTVRVSRRRVRGDGVRQALAMFAAVTCLLAGAGALPTLADRRVEVAGTVGVRVGPADTLWSIASENRVPDVPIAQVVERIRTLNHLAPGENLHPGDTLTVPCVDDPSSSFAMR